MNSVVGFTVTVGFICVFLLQNSSAAELSRSQKRCFVNKTWYEDGETFSHFFRSSPCRFTCTCIVKKVGDRWAPTGSCVHRCPPFSYPPFGCYPVSDKCCASKYICPDGEKCKDNLSGMLYQVGQKWQRNEACECTCLGEGEGKYQCVCVRENPNPEILSPEERENTVDKNCIPKDSESCAACPIGMNTCPVRAKCETWPYTFSGINMKCTCYGKNGTRCVSVGTKQAAEEKEGENKEKKEADDIGVREDNDRKESEKEKESGDGGSGIEGGMDHSGRTKRSTPGEISSLYYSEGQKQIVEKSLMEIEERL